MSSENLKIVVQKLIELDEEEARYKNLLNEIKDKKEEMSDIVMNIIISQKIEEKDIILGEKKVKCITTRNPESITKKLINDKLEMYFNDRKRANEVTQFIYSQRNVITKKLLKISSK
jgi:hypothetical protein